MTSANQATYLENAFLAVRDKLRILNWKYGAMMSMIGTVASKTKDICQEMINIVININTSSKAIQTKRVIPQEIMSEILLVSDCNRAINHPEDVLSK